MHKIILLSALAFATQVASRIAPGMCEHPSLQPNFDASRYLGVWFQQARDINAPFENGNCAQTRYSMMNNGSLAVTNSQFINASQFVF